MRRTIDTQSRLSMFPRRTPGLRAPATIHWDTHLIPSIHAPEPLDVPYCIGLVHAHLRLGQMELLKRISQGRLAEIGGPALRRIDHTLRTIDLARAVPAIIDRMDPEAKRWLTRYLEGINDFKARLEDPPPDCRTLGIDAAEAWTLADVLTIGRLASADINWGKWLTLLPLRTERGYDEYLDRLRRFAEAGTSTFGPGTPTPLDALLDVGKTGSNAFVISGDRSATGSAIFAGDPHLGLPQPNIWCVLGYRSKRDAAIGLTIPGLPFVLVGRNDFICWGGTNMNSLSTVLYDVGAEPLRERRERIRTRWAPPKTVVIRESAHGPVISDAPLFKRISDTPVALRWRGHEPSDEAAAMLRLSRAESWSQFKEAFRTWSTGGQNFLFADRHANIGQVIAIEFVPAAGRAAFKHVVSPDEDHFRWSAGIPSPELPSAYNPDDGFLVSANNTPTRTDPPLLALGNTNDRVHRIAEVLASSNAITVDDMRRLQRDTFSETSLEAARLIAALATDRPSPILDAIRAWDGRYDADSQGALAYQLTLHVLLDLAYEGTFSRRIIRHLRRGPHVHEFVRQDLDAGTIPPETVAQALLLASRRWRPGRAWGDVHRVGLAHPIGRAPVLGRRFRFGDLPTGGSSTTVHKSNHPITDRRHIVRFGACARHIFDMSDPDANLVVLLGGQDGWIGSAHMLDHVPLWQSGEMIPLPLRPESQRARAIESIELAPST